MAVRKYVKPSSGFHLARWHVFLGYIFVQMCVLKVIRSGLFPNASNFSDVLSGIHCSIISRLSIKNGEAVLDFYPSPLLISSLSLSLSFLRKPNTPRGATDILVVVEVTDTLLVGPRDLRPPPGNNNYV